MSAPSPAVNYWPQTKSAKVFWAQHEWPPYRQLLAETIAWLDPRPGERWIDLGCGGGQLTRALWRASAGSLAEIIGLDCAAANERAFGFIRAEEQPPPGERIHFLAADFSTGLPFDGGDLFDGVVSGLAIQYAEAYSVDLACWTTAAYDRVLAEVHRVLRPGGRFVFSVNVPDPSWIKIAMRSVSGVFISRRPLRYLQKAWAMWKFGGWLKREARRGRFHYLHRSVVAAKLHAAGFVDVEHQRSFAGQAYLFRCRKPSGASEREASAPC